MTEPSKREITVMHELPCGWQTGVYDCFTNESYHSFGGISKSDLDLLHKSPLHYAAAQKVKREETPAMKLGTAFHCSVLERERFVASYVAIAGDRRVKAVKKSVEAAEAEGKIVLTDDEMAMIEGMTQSVFMNTICQNLLANSVVEHSVLAWLDDVPAKCRPDGWQMDKGVLFDLKSTEDASAGGFSRAVATYRYHVQDSYYRNVVASVTNDDPDKLSFIFVVVEKKPPFALALYTLDDRAKLQGWVEYREDLRTYRTAREKGFTGYSPRIETVSLPHWASSEF